MKKEQLIRNLLCASMLMSMPVFAYGAEANTSAVDSFFDEDVDLVVTGTRIHEAPIGENNIVAGGQVAKTADYGVLGNRSTMDTPFNATTITSQLMDDVQANNIVDVIAMDASTNNQTLSGASQAWAIRGFRAQQQDVAFNGLHGVAPRFYTGTESIDRVEIVKGASALLYGMSPNGSVGGSINYVPKRASGKENDNAIKLTYGDGKQFGQQLDYGFRTDDKKWGFHTTLFHSNGSTSFSNEQIKTSSAAVGIDRQGSHSRFYFDAGYAYNDVENPQYRLTFGNGYDFAGKGLPTADHNKKYGSPDTFRHVTEKYGVARYEYDFTKNFSAYAALGMRETKMDYLYNDFRLNNNGSASLRYHYNNQVNKANSAEIGVKGKFRRGGFDNEVTLAANRYEWKRYMANRLSDRGYYATSYDNPAWTTSHTWATSQDWEEPLNDKNILTGLSLTDVITTPDKKWTFILGGRYQHIKQTSYATPFSNTSGTYEEHAFSPAFGLVRKVNDHMSLYANYMEGLSAGDIVGSSYENEGELLAPQKTKQIEVGAKWETAKTLTTLSLFQMRQDATMDQTTATGTILTNDGQVRNRGIELSVAGEPKEGTRIMGSLMYLDSKYTAGNSNVGNTYMGTPHWQAVARVEQDIKGIKGLSLSARANYQSSAYINAANTAKVGGRLTWDLGAKYKFNGLGGHPMTLRADVYNVFNKDYWNAMSNASALYIGKGRTAVVSLETRF